MHDFDQTYWERHWRESPLPTEPSRVPPANPYVVDETRGTIACAMEILYVHVSMQTRRSAPIPDDVSSALDGEIANQTWAAEAATGLTLRR